DAISLLISCTDPSTTVIYTLSLHDALPILPVGQVAGVVVGHHPAHGTGGRHQVNGGQKLRHVPHPPGKAGRALLVHGITGQQLRSEEHTSELQSRENLVCRLLLEKKKKARP